MHAENFTEQERKALQGLLDVLQQCVVLRPNMPIHQLLIAIGVALDEGHPLKHYSDKLGFPTSNMSRTFLDFGPKMRSGKPGLGLLEARTSIRSLREYQTHLTAKGREIMKAFAANLTRNSNQD